MIKQMFEQLDASFKPIKTLIRKRMTKEESRTKEGRKKEINKGEKRTVKTLLEWAIRRNARNVSGKTAKVNSNSLLIP